MATKADFPIFYVYEHWRPDTDTCFWVGKGHGRRAHEMRRRNQHHSRILAKLARAGFAVDVRITDDGLTERDALTLETLRIAERRAAGSVLANVTAGGEGVSGLRHSEETKARLSAATSENRKGSQHSAETKAKIGAANKIALTGRKNPEHSARMMGRKQTAECRSRISEAGKGRRVSEETRAKIRASNTGKRASDEARANMREARMGREHSEETRAKMRATQTARWAKRREQWPQ